MRSLVRLVLIAGVVVLLITGSVGALDDPAVGVSGMARYFPAETLLFGAVRVDEAYVDQLDSLVAFFTDLVPDAPTLTFRQALNIIPYGSTADTVLAWMGDHAAVGVGGIAGDDLYMVIEVDDAAAAEVYLRDTYEDLSAVEGSEDAVVLESADGLRVTLLEDLLVLGAAGVDAALPESDTLLDSADYVQTVSELPVSGYNLIAYLNTHVLRESLGIGDDFAELGGFGGVELTLSGIIFGEPLALGATILDDDTLTLDFVQGAVRDSAEVPPDSIDPSFMQFVPAQANAVIHATNFTRLVRDTFSTLDQTLLSVFETSALVQPTPLEGQPTMTPFPTPQPPSEEVAQAFASIGIDLENDILRWTTGDYALFLDTDLIAIASAALEYRLDLEDNLGFGIIVEATDSTAAGELVVRLTDLLRQSPELAVSAETVAGVDVTALTVQAPITFPFYTFPDSLNAEPELVTFDLIFGTTEDIFFFGTRGLVESALSRASVLNENPLYNAARGYFLPDPVTVWYTDGEGFVVSALGNPLLLGLLGPSIGNIFTNIGGATPVPTPTSTPSPTPDPTQTAEDIQPFVDIIAAVEHATVSTAVSENGMNLLRMTVTLNR